MTGRAAARDLAESGWEVLGTGRAQSRFPKDLERLGVEFLRSDRTDPRQLAEVLKAGADVVVDCVAYTAEHARQLLRHRAGFGSAVVLSSKAVYVDDAGRHSNSDVPPAFGRPVPESQPVMAPDFSGAFDSREGYGANKVAMEQTLLDSGERISVLRPSRIHGEGAGRLREWFVVRRLLDGRRRIPLADGGRTGNHPTAAVNLARLIRTCAERPGQRVLNAADPGTPTAGEVVAAIGEVGGHELEVVGLAEDAEARLGWSPWATWPPFFLDMAAAGQFGYAAVGSYAETVGPLVRELLTLTADRRAELDEDAYFAGRFDYSTDDAAF